MLLAPPEWALHKAPKAQNTNKTVNQSSTTSVPPTPQHSGRWNNASPNSLVPRVLCRSDPPKRWELSASWRSFPCSIVRNMQEACAVSLLYSTYGKVLRLAARNCSPPCLGIIYMPSRVDGTQKTQLGYLQARFC